MWDILQFIFVLGVYILVGYFGIKLISKWTLKLNIYLRLLILSFFYALFWGIGIAGTDGNPGFAFPAPNIIAIGLMGSIDFFRGVITGLVILVIWWAIFFAIMLLKHFSKNFKKSIKEL
jgi:hypothetical protein